MSTATSAPRILLVRLSAIGDCLHALPLVAALRRSMPGAFIGWATQEAPHQLLHGHPLIDKFHVFPRGLFKRKEGTFFDRMRALRNFRKELRDAGYETAIDLQGLSKSGLVAWWSRARQRIGFKGEESREVNSLFMNHRVEPPETAVHIVDRNLALLGPLGITPPDKAEWTLPAYTEERAAMAKFLETVGLMDGEKAKPFAVINPGATWLTKRWPAERLGEVAKGLIERRGLPLIVTWAGKDEQLAAEEIVKVAKHPEVRIAPGTNLRELAALFSYARLFVGNDTGPLHLAVALGVPCVSVFGASDPLRNGPYGHSNRIEAGGPECQPCWKTTCARKDLACLMWVQAARVISACEDLLERTTPALAGRKGAR